MNINFLRLLTFTVFAGWNANAQELTNKIPAQAQLVVTINNKAIVEHSSIELLNETLVKLGAFEHAKTNIDYPIKSLTESDLNLDKQSYIYHTSADSLYYIGILLPLKNNHQVKQHMFSQFTVLPTFNGYERRVSKDGKTQVSWNHETLFIFTGGLHDNYFQNEDVANRYGLDLGPKPQHEYDWNYNESLDSTANTVVDTADAVWTREADASAEEETADASEEAIEASEEDTEADSLYLISQVREAKNDSIKAKLFTKWLAADFNSYLEPKQNLAENKTINLTDRKHLLRLWIPNIEELYQTYLPKDLLKMVGVDIKNVKYGYQDALIDLIQDQHSLKLSGSVGVDPDMEKVFKSLYKNKFNKKFSQYIPENHLAYASVNISTEGYFQQLPKLISRWYAPLSGEYADVLNIAATVVEIGLDEKAIGKVMKGDNIFFLNDLHKVTKEYVTYEYDDDYNSTEVTKTKEEYAPNFLWMFSSEDQRIFRKTLDFAIKRKKVTLEEGIYKIDATKSIDPIYILFKKDIVFVGNNIEQLTAIHQNRFRTSKDTKVKKDIFAYPANMVVHMSAIPQVVNQLEIPVTAAWEQTLQDLSGYGNLQIKSNKINKSRFYGELSVELPKKDKNALQYILKHIIQNLNDNTTD